VDLRKDAWKRASPERQIAALMELRRILEHTHEPVKPGYEARMEYPAVVEERRVAEPEVPQPVLIEPQAPPSLPQRYIVRLTETQMDRFLVAASAEWKQRIVQSLLDEEDDG
jgi:hypothetical protein